MSLRNELKDLMRDGKGVIIIGPAGGGKTTLAKNLLNDGPYAETLPVFIKTSLEGDSSHLSKLLSKIEYPVVPVLIINTNDDFSSRSITELEGTIVEIVSDKLGLSKELLAKFDVVTYPGEFIFKLSEEPVCEGEA